MMIYLAMVELLDCVYRIVSTPRQKVQQFVGADSSFSLFLERSKRAPDKITLRFGNTVLANVSANELVEAVVKAAKAFLKSGNELSEQDPVSDDLASALTRTERLLA